MNGVVGPRRAAPAAGTWRPRTTSSGPGSVSVSTRCTERAPIPHRALTLV
jgi:hypothetical protein